MVQVGPSEEGIGLSQSTIRGHRGLAARRSKEVRRRRHIRRVRVHVGGAGMLERLCSGSSSLDSRNLDTCGVVYMEAIRRGE